MLHEKMAELLAEEEFKPFDRTLKTLIAEPGVLRRLWDDVREAEVINIQNGEDGSIPNAIDSDKLMWAADEYTNKQFVYRTDLVASDDGALYHIEQQTRHDRITMLRRMTDYAAIISSFHRYNVELFQLYYYTGRSRVKWNGRLRSNGSILNGNWSLSNPAPNQNVEPTKDHLAPHYVVTTQPVTP